MKLSLYNATNYILEVINIFNLFKKKEQNEDKFIQIVGYYYKDHVSIYKNLPDSIEVYKRVIYSCDKHYKDFFVSKQDLRPSLYENSQYEKDAYKNKLECKGIKDDLTFEMEYYNLMCKEKEHELINKMMKSINSNES